MTDLTRDPATFRQQYGPWAVIGGASDGTGEQFARQLAALGLNLVLVARRASLMESLAKELRENHGIQVRVVLLDLSLPAAGEQLCTAVADLEVGLYIANAGAGLSGPTFVDGAMDDWRALVNLNVHTPMEVCHGLAGAMKQRRRGGLLLMSSGVALGGQPRVSVYCSGKAFGLNLAESLWAELKPSGVDVLSVVAPLINTPTLQRGLGGKSGGEIPGMFEADEVVETALRQLANGPCYIFPAGPEADRAEEVAVQRRERVQAVARISEAMFGKLD